MRRIAFTMMLMVMLMVMPLFAEEKHHPTSKTAQHLQDISVTVVLKDSGFVVGEASGVIKTRKNENGKSINFVWTAAHVVGSLRTEKTVIDSKTGTKKIVVEFDDVLIVKNLQQDGRSVGKMEITAEVIRFSAEEDLALLRIRKRGFVEASVDFYLEDKLLSIGSPVVHVGSLLGQMGSNSMTTGIVSQHGRIINKKVFDQQTAPAYPGSSGGGMFTVEGKMIGMLVRGAGETFNLIVPVRRMRKWAKRANVEWALDNNVPLPTEEEFSRMPIEDNGASFSFSARNDGKVFMMGEGQPYLGKDEMKFPTWLYVLPEHLVSPNH